MALDEKNNGSGAQVVFFETPDCGLTHELFLYSNKDNLSKKNNLDDFTGIIYTRNFCNSKENLFSLIDGLIVENKDITSLYNLCDISQNNFCPQCPQEDGNFFINLFNFFGDIFNGILDIFDNNNNNNNNNNSNSGSWWNINYSWPNYSSTDQTGGGTYGLQDIFNFNIFSGEGEKILQTLDQLTVEHNLYICTEVLHNLLYNCITNNSNGGGISEGGINDSNSSDNFQIELYEYADNLAELDETDICLSEIINNYQSTSLNMSEGDGSLLCFIQANNEFNISNDDMLEMFQNNCESDVDCINQSIECLGEISELIVSNGQNISDPIFDQLFDDFESFCPVNEEDIVCVFSEVLFLEHFNLTVNDEISQLLNNVSLNENCECEYNNGELSINYINCLVSGILSNANFEDSFVENAELNALFPLSCETFIFEDCLHLFQSTLTGVSANFFNLQTEEFVICPLTFNIIMENKGYDLLGNSIILSVGQLQNITAEAYNNSIDQIVSIYANPNVSDIDCEYLEDEFAEIMNTQLFEVAVNKYGISEWFTEEPFISFDMDEFCIVENSLPKYDLSAFFGLLIDECE